MKYQLSVKSAEIIQSDFRDLVQSYISMLAMTSAISEGPLDDTQVSNLLSKAETLAEAHHDMTLAAIRNMEVHFAAGRVDED